MKRKLLLILLVIIAISLFLIINEIKVKNQTPTINSIVTLYKNQSVLIKDAQNVIVVKITGFCNAQEPDDVSAMWEGLAVYYEITINGVTYTTDSYGRLERAGQAYQMNIIDTDYNTFAKIQVNRSEIQ